MDIIVSKPELGTKVSKSLFITVPVTEKIHWAIESPLEDSPPPTVSFLVTEGFYEAGTIRVDVIKAILGVSFVK